MYDINFLFIHNVLKMSGPKVGEANKDWQELKDIW